MTKDRLLLLAKKKREEEETKSKELSAMLSPPAYGAHVDEGRA
ncbi:hypothetical protein Q0590_31090 [Rhodocytophaga aerolata]|uniref:Uncharacterized protein n=1 Tax=Rhodocytophaga aerolata TaxID=455078 RepID=A0ABT8RIX3_9BACT|nr:hypothetical protein [Rhodocytophaga aerolata]MDO1450760.1 hypothetical protein [Rhodocytophaga aerolata]